MSVHLKEILDAESPSDSANNEKTENSKDKLASEEEIVVDKELFPTTSQHTASKDKVTLQPDDCRSVQIKAGKAEVKY